MGELLFGIPQTQHISLNLVFVEGEVGEGSGEMEEEFVENRGKQCIGPYIDRTYRTLQEFYIIMSKQ